VEQIIVRAYEMGYCNGQFLPLRGGTRKAANLGRSR
jgi:hypothetical protein